MTLGEAVFNRNVFALDIACFLKSLAKSAQRFLVSVSRLTVEKSHHRHRWPLRPRRERPRNHAAEQRDEVAPLHVLSQAQETAS